MKIQVLGAGCPKCKQLAENAVAAAEELNIDFELEKISNINDIIAFGVMLTPALALDGKVKISGKVPNTDAIKKILEQETR